MAKYQLTADDAERINARQVRSHSDVREGDVFPAILARQDDIKEYDPATETNVKVGTLSHLHVFLPDHVENVKVEDRSEGEKRKEEREAKRQEEIKRLADQPDDDLTDDDDEEVTE